MTYPKRIHQYLFVVMAALLNGCMVAPSPPPPDAGPTAMAQWVQTVEATVPVDPNVLKQPQIQTLVDALSKAGLNPHAEEGLRPEIRVLGVKVDGVTFRVKGDPLTMYWFPTKTRANLGVTQFKQTIANIMDLVPDLRFYQCDRVLVNYVGVNKVVLDILETRCGAPFIQPMGSTPRSN